MTDPKGAGSITVVSATAIGVGGMMGAGLYTLLGLASTTAGVWLPAAFVVGGVVSVFSVYSTPSSARRIRAAVGRRSS